MSFFVTQAYAQIRVATAANTQFAMKEIVDVYENEVGQEVDLIFGSSGKLVAQIRGHAPYHIFVSANEKYAQSVYKQNKAIGKPIVYAKGSLVLWTTKDINLSKGLSVLKAQKIKTIAIPSPKNAPYGALAISALNDLNIYDSIKK